MAEMNSWGTPCGHAGTEGVKHLLPPPTHTPTHKACLLRLLTGVCFGSGSWLCLPEVSLFALLPRTIGRPSVPQASRPAVQLSGAVSGRTRHENIWVWCAEL